MRFSEEVSSGKSINKASELAVNNPDFENQQQVNDALLEENGSGLTEEQLQALSDALPGPIQDDGTRQVSGQLTLSTDDYKSFADENPLAIIRKDYLAQYVGEHTTGGAYQLDEYGNVLIADEDRANLMQGNAGQGYNTICGGRMHHILDGSHNAIIGGGIGNEIVAGENQTICGSATSSINQGSFNAIINSVTSFIEGGSFNIIVGGGGVIIPMSCNRVMALNCLNFTAPESVNNVVYIRNKLYEPDILTSQNGTRYRLAVANNGSVSAVLA